MILADHTALRDRALLTIGCDGWAQQQGWPLRRAGGELVGPCPVCGGRDRFSISPAKNIWNCRGCGKGGDVIALVQHTENLGFLEACGRITGERAGRPLSAAEQARLDADRRQQREQQERAADYYRQQARRDAKAIWDAAHRIVGIEPPDAGVAPYLQLRGLGGGTIDFGDPEWSMRLKLPLRFNTLTYWHEGQKLHTGPVMIAAIQYPDDRLAGVHLTYLDLGRPKGKLQLVDGKGEALPAKKVRGVHKGCAIRLVTPADARRLVMGEGIETTLTAYAHAFEPATAYWAGVAIGNMAGKAARNVNGGMVHDQPNMDDLDCFLPPDWVEELVYLCDSDEPEKRTVEKVTRGLRRAWRFREAARRDRPELSPLMIKMAPPGATGTDLNDLAMTPDDEGEARAVPRDGRPQDEGSGA